MARPKTKRIRMFSGRALVRPDEPIEKIGNIILPDIAKAKPVAGIVLAVAEEPHHWENGQPAKQEMRLGQSVIFGRYPARSECRLQTAGAQ